MFIQGFSKIGPPNKEELGYLHYDHYNRTLIDLTNGCSWTFLLGVALTYTNIIWKEGEVLLIWALQYDVQWFWMTQTVLSDNIKSPLKGKLKHSSEADKALKNNSAQTHEHGFTYHSQGKVVEEVVVTFRWDLLMWWRRVDLHLKHKEFGKI